MSAEDRDRQFENALARQLRSDAAGDSACLDPELLAAYHERMLSPEEMIVRKEHLASCGRCQEILARLEATEHVVAPRNVEADFVVARTSSQPHSGPLLEEESSLLTAPSLAREPKNKIASFPDRKKSLLRWAAPAGAIAAGLLLWIGVREVRAPAKSAVESSEIADNRTHSSGGLNGAPARPQLAEKEKAETSREGAYMIKPAVPPAAEPSDELRNSRSALNLGDGPRADKKTASPLPKGPSQLSSPPAKAIARGEGAGSPPAGTGVAGGEIAAKTNQLQAGSQAIESDESQVAVQQSEINQQAVPAARAAAPPPPAAPAREKQPTIATAQAPAPTLEMKDSNQPAVPSEAFYKLSRLTSVVAAPGGKSLWRFGASGAVMHSSDAGRNWQPQSSGVTVDLTLGSAPSENVCWIAGAAGTLLFSKDGGKHWTVITTPIAGDLGGVSAADAKHASIWDAPHRVVYQTSDGGATWKQSSSQ